MSNKNRLVQPTLAREEEESKPAPQAPESRPPYIPWKSFESFVALLKSNSHPPDAIDGGIMPSNMSGGLQRQLRSALKFTGLTNISGKVTESFSDLIKAHGSGQWPMAVKEN